MLYTIQMKMKLKRYNVFLDAQSLKALASIGERKGLKIAQIIRVALSEFISRETKRKS